MKIVLDTNVLVSGLLQPFGPPGEIVRTVSSGTLQICYDARTLTEYKEVMRRPKFNFNFIYINSLLDQVEAMGVKMAAEPLAQKLPDADDQMFLEIAAQAKFLW